MFKITPGIHFLDSAIQVCLFKEKIFKNNSPITRVGYLIKFVTLKNYVNI
jgi:hypothetical protein